jgi:hypothetical protein
LHDEIARLPEAYRAPLVLCGLEGRSCEDAATHLGWPVGTVKSRLARGRKKLRGRLSGVLHSSAVIAALSTSKQATFACVPNKLHVAVTSAAIQLITPIAGATGVVPVAVT